MSGSDYLPRHLDERLVASLAAAPVVILDGPRGVGKTTTARRVAASAVMLPRDLPALEVDPERYLLGLEAPVLIDEWQLAGTDLLWTVKGIVDRDPSPGRFLLTGSVEPATYGPTYPLTGRAVQLVMRPMTRAELEGRGDQETFLSRIVASGRGKWTPAAAGAAFDITELTVPGFPAARRMPDPGLFLDAYAGSVSQRAGDEGRDASRLLRTMRVLATLEGQAVPDQRIWDAADINKVTWKAYEDLLTRTYLTAPLPAYETNRLKRLTAYPKRFLADTALALALARVGADDLVADPSLAGAYLESFVLQQLRPQADLAGVDLSHLRTTAGTHEVDLVVEIDERIIGLEVKHAPRPTASAARPLAWLRDQLGDRFSQGYVVHTGQEAYALGERIWAVPVGDLLGA